MLSGLVSSGLTGPTRSRHNVGPLWISAKNKQPLILETVKAGTFPKNHALTVDGSVFLGSPSFGAGTLYFYQNNTYAPVVSLVGSSDVNNIANLRCSGNFLTQNLYVSYSSSDCRMSATGNGADFVNLGSNMAIRWDSVASATPSALGASADLLILRDAAGIFAQRNGLNAQTFRLYTTYTSATSYETLNLKGKAAANFEIGPESGSAGGTLRGLTIGGYAAGTATIASWLSFTSAGVATFAGQVIESPPASVTLATNGQFSIEMTSNTAGNLVYRGSDGTTRRSALVFA